MNWLLFTKAMFCIGCFFLAFLAGMVPIFFNACKNSKTLFSVANSFAGGVFMAIAFIHIMPEAMEMWEEYLHHDQDHDSPNPVVGHGDGDEPFPLPFALLFVGYTLILLIDKVLFDPHKLMGDHGHDHGVSRNSISKSFHELQANAANGEPLDKQATEEALGNYFSKSERFTGSVVRASQTKKEQGVNQEAERFSRLKDE